jgi:hypothetical protein
VIVDYDDDDRPVYIPCLVKLRSFGLLYGDGFTEAQRQAHIFLISLHLYEIPEAIGGGHVHHIVPKGVRGHPKDKRNLIRLSCLNHFKVHVCLAVLSINRRSSRQFS